MTDHASPSPWLWPAALSLLLLTGISHTACRPDTSKSTPDPAAVASRIRLEEVPGIHTGITFNNVIDETGRINIFTWHFLYNGAGVAAGDINNDGLPDLYFAGTMTSDKLYLNKGDFRFEDITASAGIQPGMFSSGVTMVDINADGLLDIYVCRNSPTGIADNNRNLLYINQGGNQFVERAAEYGLADIGFGVQATFFDFDQDGDLDMYLVNQPFDEFARLVNRPDVVAGYPATDRLFVQDNGFFRDQTASFGLLNARNGLNASLGDFDLNGWTDLYVCNDYHLGDHLYMNQDGRLTDQLSARTGHTSFYSMGSDAGDINNDGWPDVFTLDMAFEDHYRSKTNMGSMDPARFWGLVADGHHFQYMQNVLQVNQGDGYFSDMAQLAGLAKTDWSWSALLADLNCDSRQDILVTNGVLRDMQNNDFNQMVKSRYQGMVGPHNYIEVLNSLPSQPVHNLIFQNEGDLQFSRLLPEEGFSRPGFSHGMAYADLDGDGWLDLVVNNMNAPASVYRNSTDRRGHYLSVRLKGPEQNRHGLGVTLLAYAGGDVQTHTMQTTRGYMSSVEPAIHLGLGPATRVDSLFVIWNHKAMSVIRELPADQSVIIDFDKEKKIPFRNPLARRAAWIADNAPDFQHIEQPFDDYREQVLLPYKLSQQGPFLATADVNGDGIPDLFAGGGAGQAGAIFLGRPDGSFTRMAQPALDADSGAEDQQAIFFDVDRDGDLDLFVVSGSNEFHDDHPTLRDRLYLNDGSGRLSVAPAGMLPEYRINGQCVAGFDLGGDGDTDLIVFGRLKGGRYGHPADAILLENDNGRLVDATEKAAPFLRSFGMVTDAAVVDIDGDGDDDMLVVGEWLMPTLLLQQPGGKIDTQSLTDPGIGLWWTVEAGDMDGDKDVDFLLGNLGWNNKFGGRGAANLEVYAGDLDANGDFDVVLAVEKKDKVLPVRGRECSSQELPFILDKFPTYDSFAKAGLSDIYPADMLGQSSHFKLNTLSSIYLENQGDGRFVAHPLPLACQTGPLKAVAIRDFNRDGFVDFAYAGNHLPTEVETARYDGLVPGIAHGDGQGNFECRPLGLHTWVFPGDFRDIALLEFPSAAPSLIMSVNHGPLIRLQPGQPAE